MIPRNLRAVAMMALPAPRRALILVKEATASYDKREYALAAKLFQEAVAKGATDRVTLYNTMAPT